MTRTEMLDLTNLSRQIETVESLIPVRYPDAVTEQRERFHSDMADAVTTADKLDVTRDWLDWMAS